MSLLSDPRWSDALTRLPDYLGSHVRVSLTAIALGLAISFPLALSTGLLEKGETLQPHNVLLVPEAEFTVLLPARRVENKT